MAGQLRQDKVQEKGQPGAARSRNILPLIRMRWLAGTLLFTLLLLLPFFFGLRPISEYLGMRAPADKFSRISFQWTIPDRQAIEERVEATHYPVYEEMPRGAWISTVFNPVASLLEKAIDLRSPDLLLEHARKEDIELSPDEAKTLVDFVLKELDGGLYVDIINPIRRVLDQWVYTRGVLSKERYEKELASGTRSIEIIEPGNRFSRGRIIEVGRESGPLSTEGVPSVLAQAFYDKLLLVRSHVRTTLVEIVARRIAKAPTLVYEKELTNETLRKRKELAIQRASQITQNEPILTKGQRVTPEVFDKLRSENEAFTAGQGVVPLVGQLVGKSVLVFVICICFVIAMQRLGKGRGVRPTALLALPVVALMYLLVFNGVSLTLLPAGILIACAALGGGAVVGLLTALTFCGFAFTSYSLQAGSILSILISGALCAVLISRQRFRMGLAEVMLVSGVVGALTFLSWQLGNGEQIVPPEHILDIFHLEKGDNLLVQAVWIVFSWLFSYALLLLVLPLLQGLYGVTTNLRLQDLQEHPLLTKLLIEAPSTYYHSSVVSALAETAAQAIGANSLLCKTACLYHDIGKLVKPEYFTENESGISRHDSLSPSMSALIIISHVKDGAEMGRQWRLPGAITDIISQHHGTTLVSFFLRQAREQAEDPDEVDEELYRYPGPRPQFKEAAVCMIADSVEAASRSLDGASPARIRSLVHSIVIGKLEDRQFDESTLNFTDLARIEDALVKILTSMFHSRVKYDKSEKPARRR